MILAIIIFVFTFAILGLLLGISASYDAQLSDDIERRDLQLQTVLFDKCVTEAESNGELTEEEYFKCAYSIYD